MSTADVRRRIRSISETRQITKAMELISVSKLKKAFDKNAANLVYYSKVRATIKDVLAHSEGVTHRYFSRGAGDKTLFIAIAGSKGLAGSYNDEILSFALDRIGARDDRSVFAIGAVAEDFFAKKGIAVDAAYPGLLQNPTLHDARGLMRDILELFREKLLSEVWLIYTGFRSAADRGPRAQRLLPLGLDDLEDVEPEIRYGGTLNYDPSPKEVLNVLVPQYLVGMIYAALVQAAAAENSARMTAMASANRNADELLRKLTLEYNRARQDAVTAELLDAMSSRR